MPLRSLALICFFLSGATGLLYQVLWTRLLGTTIGNTHFSITTVVSVFMGGLALGSWLGGRLADRSGNPLRLYGVLNLLGALLCLAVPPATELGRPLFAWLYGIYEGEPQAPPLLASRILFAALLILAPTTCMGATLPALARYFATRLSEVGFTVGRLYSVNTFGAVLGVFFAGFWAMEHLGVVGTTALAVTVDIAIGIAVIALSRGATAPRPSVPEPVPSSAGPAPAGHTQAAGPGESRRLPAGVHLAVWAFGITGFANMCLQIGWTKAIVQTIGNSTYAFSLIVTLFILGIGLGGGLATLVADRVRGLRFLLGALVAATGLSVSLTVPLLGRFPIWGARWFDSVETPDYGTFLGIKMWMVAAAILPSTVLMGTVFPIVGKIRTRALERIGSAVGNAYFANTLGAILGTLAAGFVFVPLFGRIYWTIYLGAALNLLTGLVLLASAPKPRPAVRAAFAGTFALLVLVPAWVLRPHGVLGSQSSLWDPAILSKGAYVYYHGSYWMDRRREVVRPVDELVEDIRETNEVLSYEEGIHAPVAVVRNPTRGIALRISGKVEASIPAGGGYNRDLPHQLLAGHLPMILHPEPREVLTLGLGGGVTLGTLTLYPVRRIDSLEISREVMDAAREYFAGPNRGALSDSPLRPVRHIVGDGRHHLLYTTKRYDVITSVPSNPWIAGIGTLFTKEFFEICKERLAPGGIVCNWIHKIHMRAGDIRTVFRTFVDVFGEHAQLWDLGYDCLLIGSDRPVRLDAGRLEGLLERSEVRSDLEALGIVDAATLLRHWRWGPETLAEFAGAGPLNTDATPVLEFSCPRGLYGHPLDAYRAIAETPPVPISADRVRGASQDRLRTALRLQKAFGLYQKVHALVDRFERIVTARRNAGADAAFGVDPISGERVRIRPSASERRALRRDHLRLLDLFGRLHRLLEPAGDTWLRRRTLLRAHNAFGGQSETLAGVLVRHFREMAAASKEPSTRLAWLDRALPWADGRPDLIRRVARLWLETGQAGKGAARFASLAERLGDRAAFLHSWGILVAASGDFESAKPLFARALERSDNPVDRSRIHHDLGYGYARTGHPERAREHLERALQLDPGNTLAADRLRRLESR